jgi:hypothetical protein
VQACQIQTRPEQEDLCFTEEHLVALFYNLGFISQKVLRPPSDDLLAHLLRVLTPDCPIKLASQAKVGPVLNTRNLLCTALAIHGFWLPWMAQAEPADILDKATDT